MNNHFHPQNGKYGRTESSNGAYGEDAPLIKNFGDMSQGK